jgi:homogentisate 1,2-dioxygenase
MKSYFPVSRVEGTASRQAHCDLPEGTYEREMSKEGFFGPAAFFHHRHPPTGWTDFTGPLRPRALDLNRLASGVSTPWSAPAVLSNANCAIRYWRMTNSMERLARNADGDELLFMHAGTAR